MTFGFRLFLNDDEKRQVNERWQSNQWGPDISSREAIESNSTDKKKEIQESPTFSFFYVRINEEGFWNKNQIAL